VEDLSGDEETKEDKALAVAAMDEGEEEEEGRSDCRSDLTPLPLLLLVVIVRRKKRKEEGEAMNHSEWFTIPMATSVT